MNIIISGCGNVGYHLARTLMKEGHNVTVIDADPKSANASAASSMFCACRDPVWILTSYKKPAPRRLTCSSP